MPGEPDIMHTPARAAFPEAIVERVMKQSPKEKRIQDLMRPGRLTLEGMLGDDRRMLSEIIEADQSLVNNLGVTHADIADRLEALTRAGRAGLETEVTVEDAFDIHVRDDRGMVPCPFGDRRCAKSVTVTRCRASGEEVVWTDLSVHMIREHGFYEGRGSPFRVEPARAVRVLGIASRRSDETNE